LQKKKTDVGLTLGSSPTSNADWGTWAIGYKEWKWTVVEV
jgi:hypothetical protein